MSKKSGSDNLETREDTAGIEISCSVEGYQKCRFNINVGEEFLIYKKIGSRGRAFKVTSTRRLLEGSLILFDWFKNWTHSKIDVRFCLIAEPNQTPIIWLSSIGFLFDFVWLHTPGIERFWVTAWAHWGSCETTSIKGDRARWGFGGGGNREVWTSDSPKFLPHSVLL